MGTQPLSQKGRSPTQFSAHVYRGQTAAWINMPCHLVQSVRCGPSYPQKKGHTHPIQFLAHVCCGQMAGWMKTPLGTEVDLGPGHTVPDGVPTPAKWAQQPPLFLAHVYCGHCRPSQLLLSSCTNGRLKTMSLVRTPKLKSFQLWTEPANEARKQYDNNYIDFHKYYRRNVTGWNSIVRNAPARPPVANVPIIILLMLKGQCDTCLLYRTQFGTTCRSTSTS